MHPKGQRENAIQQECRRIQRIRARASYSLFWQLYDFLKTAPSVSDILWKFYDVLDAKQSFGSRTNAAFAAESLKQVLEDTREVRL